MKRICCLTLALLFLPGGLSGRQQPDLVPGTRVRVAMKDPAPGAGSRDAVIIGALESIGGPWIVLRRPGGEVISVPVSDARLYVSAGAGFCGSGNRRVCVLLGLLGGAVAGYGLPALLTSVADAREISGRVYSWSIPVGALAGAIIGVTAGRERWQPVDLRPFLRAVPAVLPTGRRSDS